MGPKYRQDPIGRCEDDDSLDDSGVVAACIGFTAFTAFIVGSYPALYLSSFQPVRVLKGVCRAGRLASIPRKVLVVLQFTVSIAMIIGTMIVFRQIQFARNRPVGYEQGGPVMMHMPDFLVRM